MSGYKTYLVAFATVAGALASYFAGSITLEQALSLIVPAVLAATVRHGIKNGA